jgi:hypothetical protein
MSADEPLKHIRRPALPWRDAPLTECGRPVGDVRAWIDRGEALAMVAKHGIRRAAFMICMTCMTTANQYPEWDDDPRGALAREFLGAARDQELGDHLRAIGLLVAAHRAEFDDLLAGLKNTVSLADARKTKRRRAAG